MADQFTNADALNVYLTGDANAYVDNPDDSLGGEATLTTEQSVHFFTRNALPGVVITYAAAQCGVGVGSIIARSANSLAFAAPGEDYGATVTINDGETAVLESATPSKYIRITRVNDTALGGEMQIKLVNVFNNAIGQANATSAERTSGKSSLRALIVRNDSAVSLTNVKAWTIQLGAEQTTDTAQLPSSGAGTITTTGSFLDWPESGYAIVRQQNGAKREVIYYSTRTAQSLTVPAAGRNRDSTGTSAGAATDTVESTHSGAVYTEPLSSGSTTVLSDETDFSGIGGWTTRIENTSSANAYSIGTLAPGDGFGMLIARDIVAGATVLTYAEMNWRIQYDYDGNTYTKDLRGFYRAADDSLDRYELYLGTATSAVVTATSLPFSYSYAAPTSGTDTIQPRVLKRNKYNLASLNTYTHDITIDTAGDTTLAPPSKPANVSLTNLWAGYLLLEADYFSAQDGNAAATRFRYAVNSTNAASGATAAFATIGLPRSSKKLSVKIGPFPQGATVNAVVAAERESDNALSATAANDTTVDTLEAGAALGQKALLGYSWLQRTGDPVINRTVIVDAGNSIEHRMRAGYTDFYSGSNWIYRLRYNSADATNNGIWTTYAIDQSVVSGTANGSPIDVDSANLWYYAVDGERVASISVTNADVNIAAIIQDDAQTVDSASTDPVAQYNGWITFQVYDPFTYRYVTVISIDGDGVLYSRVPWRQVANTGDIP